MIGGDADAIERCRPVLEPICTVSHCGPVDMGQVMKLGNNAISIGTFALIMEVREMASRQGMDLGTLMEFLIRSTGRSFVSENFRFGPERTTLTGMPVGSKNLASCASLRSHGLSRRIRSRDSGFKSLLAHYSMSQHINPPNCSSGGLFVVAPRELPRPPAHGRVR